MPLISLTAGRCHHFTWPKYLSAEGGADPMNGSGSGNASTMLTYLHNREAGINAANGTTGWKFAGPRVYFQNLADLTPGGGEQTWCKNLAAAGYVTAVGWAGNITIGTASHTHDPSKFTAAQYTTIGNWMKGIPGTKVFLPFGEFDRALPGGTTAAQWIAGWRLMVNTISAIDANVIFGYCVTASHLGTLANPGPTRNYYPGDAYVDIVCPQGYNGGGTRTPAQVFTGWHAAFNVTNGETGHRPLGITEWATVERMSSATVCLNFPNAVAKPTWNNDFRDYINNNDVRIEAIFETDKCRDGTGGIVIDGRADSIAGSNNHSMTGASFVAYSDMIAKTDASAPPPPTDVAPDATNATPFITNTSPVVNVVDSVNDATTTWGNPSPAPTYTHLWQNSADGGTTWLNTGARTTVTTTDSFARTVAAGAWGTPTIANGATGWSTLSGTASRFSVANPWGLIQLPAPGGASQTSSDNFNRAVAAGGWGPLPVGTAGGASGWTVANGTASFFSVDGTRGTIDLPGPTQTTFSDTFTRTTANGWGPIEVGPGAATGWNLGNGTAANFSTNGTTARIDLPAANATQQIQLAGTSHTDVDITCGWIGPTQATGGNPGDGQFATLIARWNGNTNFYQARFIQNATGPAHAWIRSVENGTQVIFQNVPTTNITNITPGVTYHLRFRVVGGTLQAKIWTGANEPGQWDVQFTAASPLPGGDIGVGAGLSTNTTTNNPVHTFDGFQATIAGAGSASAVQQVIRAGVPALTDANALVDWSTTQTAVGSTAADGQFAALYLRFVDMQNNVQARFIQDALGGVSIWIRKLTGGTPSNIVSPVAAQNVTDINASTLYRLRFQAVGGAMQAKIWPAASTEPTVWDAVGTDPAATFNAGDAAVCGALSTNTTTSNPIFHYDNFSATAAGASGSTDTTRNAISAGQVYRDANVASAFQVSALPTGPNAGDGTIVGLYARAADSANGYYGRVEMTKDGAVRSVLQKVIAGTPSTIASAAASISSVSVNTTYQMHLTVTGSLLTFSAWSGGTEPLTPDVSVTDTSIAVDGDSGCVAAQLTSATTSSPLVRFGSFALTAVSSITAATGSTYIPSLDDLNKPLRVLVTATNTAGADTKATPQTSPVTQAGSAPTAGTVTLSDPNPNVTEVITAQINQASFGGVPAPSFAEQWQTSPDLVTWTNAPAPSTSLTYTITNTSLIGQYLRVRVIATNPSGNTSANPSYATSATPIAAATGAPTNQTAPFLGFAPPGAVNASILTDNGAWTNSPTGYTYSWWRQLPGQATWQVITGQTFNTYQLVAGDVGYMIQSRVVASNALGASSPIASSNTAGPIIVAAAPTGGAPTLSDTSPQVQQVITCDALGGGPWVSATVISFGFQWQVSTDGATWVAAGNVPNACASSLTPTCSYTVFSTDETKFLRCLVTATNATGPTSIATNPSSAVTAAGNAPAVILTPLLQPPPGNPVTPGSVLTTGNGSWTNSPTGYAYQWLRRLGTSGLFSPLAGATAQSVTVLSTDVGYQFECRVTATNGFGSGVAFSQASTLVTNPASFTIRVLSPTNGQHVALDPVPFLVTAEAQDGLGGRPSSITATVDGQGSGTPLQFQSTNGTIHTFGASIFVAGAGIGEAHSAHIQATP